MRKTKILVVDDDAKLVKLISSNLARRGFDIAAASDGKQALEMAISENPDLVILDIMLPLMDGYQVCRKLREESGVPIIMLSARGGMSDKVECLNAGADDYLTKPFDMEELLARVNAVLRRHKKVDVMHGDVITIDDLTVDIPARKAFRAKKEIKLTPTEFDLLRELVTNAGKALDHIYLLQRIWGQEYIQDTEYLRVFISRLRTKLATTQTGSDFIETVPGYGYRFMR